MRCAARMSMRRRFPASGTGTRRGGAPRLRRAAPAAGHRISARASMAPPGRMAQRGRFAGASRRAAGRRIGARASFAAAGRAGMSVAGSWRRYG